MVDKTAELTLDEFIERYSQQGPFEVIDGEIVPLSPTVAGHNWISKTLLTALLTYNVHGTRGEVVYESPYVLEDTPNWVTGARVPDLMFFAKSRWDAYTASTPDWRSKPYLLVPDLVVEIVSPNDRYTEITAKLARYFRDGVKAAWVIDQQSKTVAIHTADNQSQLLTLPDALDGGDLLPGFSIALSDLFA